MAEDRDEQQEHDHERNRVVCGQRRFRRIELVAGAGDVDVDRLRNAAAVPKIADDVCLDDVDAGFQGNRGRRNDIQRHRTLSVDATYRARVDRFLDRGHCRQRQHRALRRVDRDFAQFVEIGIATRLPVQVNVDLVVGLEEFVDEGPVGQRRYRVADVAGVHAELGHAIPVRADFDQRLRQRQ